MDTLITEKKGMSQLFDEKGNAVPVTILQVGENLIAGKKTKETDGYMAVVIGRGEKKNSSKAEQGKFKELKKVPKEVMELRVTEDTELKIGDKIEIDFEVGDKVVVTAITKGKGFQGVVKRWGFKGGPKTHGQSDRWRAGGSIGAGTTPGRVYKGKKMPGRMGGGKRTIKGLKAVKVDRENGLIAVSGSVPGNNGTVVILKKV